VTYVDRVAAEIERAVPPDLPLPEGDLTPVFRLYALLALVKGTEVTTEDVHNAWSVWMLDRDPSHRSLKPFDELDEEVQSYDEPFVRAIRDVAERLGLKPA
jgi:hypothetical protein